MALSWCVYIAIGLQETERAYSSSTLYRCTVVGHTGTSMGFEQYTGRGQPAISVVAWVVSES